MLPKGEIMKKIIITVILVLFLSGCALTHSSNYTADGKLKKEVFMKAMKRYW